MFWFDIADVLLPPVYQAIKDMYAYARTLDTELRESLVNMGLVQKNFYIQTCDEDTIKEWEDLLGVSSYTGETLEERRRFILLYLNNRFPTSEPYVRHVLGNLFGDMNYSLEFDPNDPLTLSIHIYDSQSEKIRRFLDWFAKMCPAHIKWTNAHTERSQATNYIACGTTSHTTVTTSATMSVGTETLYLGDTELTVPWVEL